MTSSLCFQPAVTYQEALQRTASCWGVELEFWDIFGHHHLASPEAQQAILCSLGIPCATTDELNAACEQRLWEAWSRLVPETLVVTRTAPQTPIEVSVPATLANSRLQVAVHLEEGGVSPMEVSLATLPTTGEAELRGEQFQKKTLRLPADLPLGYHRLVLTAGERRAESQLILCPARAYESPSLAGGGKQAGVCVSLYGLRSERNWGCGDTTDLRQLVDWMADEVHGGFIGLNPLHEIPNRQPYNTSPYLPNCSFYRNPIYLDIEAIPEFQKSPLAARLLAESAVGKELATLRDAHYVEYERVARLKLRFLRLLFRTFLQCEWRKDTARAREFRLFIEREGALLRQYALHAALDQAIHRRDRDVWNWESWPAEYRDPTSPAVEDFAQTHWRSLLFFQYLQWQLDVQFAAVQKYAQQRGLPIGLYHDLALATDRFGGDLWAHRDFYVAGCRVGAPPDDFSPSGQDWSFPPPNALAHRRDGYKLFRESIRRNCRHGGALRIDHVMRFFRLYWIPDGRTPMDGVYVQDLFEDLLRVLALESVRNRVAVIGEDLGTVAPHVRETLARFGILSYRLLYFEKQPDGRFKPPSVYPKQALVSASTHDLPTLAGFWMHADIETRRKCGFLPDDEAYRRMTEERMQEKQKLLDLLHEQHLLPPSYTRDARQVREFTGELHNAVVGFLASTPSSLMAINQEDLFKDPEQQNLPGSTAEYPNWRHKMRFTVEELATNAEARSYTAMLQGWIDRSGRRA